MLLEKTGFDIKMYPHVSVTRYTAMYYARNSCPSLLVNQPNGKPPASSILVHCQ